MEVINLCLNKNKIKAYINFKLKFEDSIEINIKRKCVGI